MNEPTYQKLGTKTLIVFILENCGPAALIFILWMVAIAARIGGTNALAALFPNSSNAAGAVASLLNVAILGGLVFFVLAVIFAVLLACIDYFTYSFALDDNGLQIKQGLLNRAEMSIPYRQIQDVDIEQSFIQQIWGVARLAVLTAGHGGIEGDDKSDDSEIALPIIDKTRAQEIREQLLAHANTEKVVVTNPAAN